VLREHAGSGQVGLAELRELGVEIGSPADAGGCDIHRGVLQGLVKRHDAVGARALPAGACQTFAAWVTSLSRNVVIRTSS
jgi:hypothetical protein